MRTIMERIAGSGAGGSTRPAHLAMAGLLVLASASWASAQTLLDVWDSTDPLHYAYVGQIQTIATAETGKTHYAFGTVTGHAASGNPSGVNLQGTHANVWVHENTISGDLTFAYIFSNAADHGSTNTAQVNFSIVGSTTDPYVSQYDDNGEVVETAPNSNTFVGNYWYNRYNSDGVAVSGIGGEEWTIIIDSVDFGNLITDWFAASGATAGFEDDLALTLGGEYRITPAGHLPDGLPADADTDGDGLTDWTEVMMAQDPASVCAPDYLDPDTDDDGLSDGDEVLLGTNPCSADTDEDGVPDSIDDEPTTPGVSSGFIEEELRELCCQVAWMGIGEFAGPNNNARAGRRNALCNKIGAAANAVAAGDFQDAWDQLQSVLQKLDDQNQPPDWMVTGAAKTAVRGDVEYAAYLISFEL